MWQVLDTQQRSGQTQPLLHGTHRLVGRQIYKQSENEEIIALSQGLRHPCARRHHTGGAHVLFYSSPTTQQTSININGRNENAEGEPRREGLPADLPHRSWKKDLPDGGKSTGGGAWHVQGTTRRGVWLAWRTVQTRPRGHHAKSQNWAALSGAVHPWPGRLHIRCATTHSGLAWESLHFWRQRLGLPLLSCPLGLG